MSRVDGSVLALRILTDDDGDWVVEAVEEASWRTLYTEYHLNLLNHYQFILCTGLLCMCGTKTVWVTL